ncbi:hypothetical protein GIB67_017492 [Kingdonia uniflora]|uniref:Transcription repressor n=1 Tax=Kingdonia uniflora TaxID=39325 RepID=A0A7J7M4F4_9MAGN|nr:hypothetical protein GIB67_017492 [Kingdonia uniflora]
MAKHFKLRLSRIIPSFHSSCLSKDTPKLPTSPFPFFRLSPINRKAIDIDFPAPKTFQDKASKRRVSSTVVSLGCGRRLKSSTQNKVHDETPRWTVYNSSVQSDSDGYVLSPLMPAEKKKQQNKKKTKEKARKSTSSFESGWFSSEGGGDDNETLASSKTFSSRTFSTDCSFELGTHLETIREKPNNSLRRKKKKKKRVTRVKSFVSTLSSGTDSPTSVSVFRRIMPCKVEGKVRESFAVVKKSEDPYEDFRRSMLEMIVEKQMFDATELEQLLHCFLSLNSQSHHGIIIQVFSEIWEGLFCKSSIGFGSFVYRSDNI